MAYIGVIGAAVAQGSEMDIPTLHQAKDEFDAWLINTDTESAAGDTLIKRALGLKEG